MSDFIAAILIIVLVLAAEAAWVTRIAANRFQARAKDHQRLVGLLEDLRCSNVLHSAPNALYWRRRVTQALNTLRGEDE